MVETKTNQNWGFQYILRLSYLLWIQLCVYIYKKNRAKPCFFYSLYQELIHLLILILIYILLSLTQFFAFVNFVRNQAFEMGAKNLSPFWGVTETWMAEGEKYKNLFWKYSVVKLAILNLQKLWDKILNRYKVFIYWVGHVQDIFFKIYDTTFCVSMF